MLTAINGGAGPQVVADHGRPEAVEIGRPYRSLHPTRDLGDEPRQARIAAQPG
jgi:hypothetical protein